MLSPTIPDHPALPLPFPSAQGDACALPADLAQFDAVLAANLLCRLPEPMAFLSRASTLVRPGGVLVLVSPYSWLAAWTPKDKWMGGKADKVGGLPRWLAGSSHVEVRIRVWEGRMRAGCVGGNQRAGTGW